MSENKIKNNEDALNAIQRGVNILAEAVSSTLGPQGRNVVVRKKHFSTVTKDGVTVASQVFLEDPYENAGAQMVKEVALRTNQIAGDGTTTATVLANAIVNAGIKNIAAGARPMDLKRGIDLAVKAVVQHLKDHSQIVGDDFGKIANVGTISANNDPAIGKLIAETMEKIGKDGVIYIEESRLTTDQVDLIEGMQVNQGFISQYFVTDTAQNIAVLDKPLILLYDGKITSIGPIIALLDQVVMQDRALLIIADDVEGETLASLIANKNSDKIRACAIRTPFGDNSKDMVRDIAKYTGATYITEDEGQKLDYATIEYLGNCERIIIGKEITTIIGGDGDADEIEEHINDLKSQIELAGDIYSQGQIRDRIAKLSKGVAVLYVGGHTEIEMREKKDRIEDALNATRAAVEEGIIPGGGVAYLRAVDVLLGLKGETEDETIGVDIIRKVLYAPLHQICINGDLAADVVAAKVRQGIPDQYGYGFNARTGEYGDMIAAGVIDPTKVARVALENAASVATLILTTSAIIVD